MPAQLLELLFTIVAATAAAVSAMTSSRAFSVALAIIIAVQTAAARRIATIKSAVRAVLSNLRKANALTGSAIRSLSRSFSRPRGTHAPTIRIG